MAGNGLYLFMLQYDVKIRVIFVPLFFLCLIQAQSGKCDLCKLGRLARIPDGRGTHTSVRIYTKKSPLLMNFVAGMGGVMLAQILHISRVNPLNQCEEYWGYVHTHHPVKDPYHESIMFTHT